MSPVQPDRAPPIAEVASNYVRPAQLTKPRRLTALWSLPYALVGALGGLVNSNLYFVPTTLAKWGMKLPLGVTERLPAITAILFLALVWGAVRFRPAWRNVLAGALVLGFACGSALTVSDGRFEIFTRSFFQVLGAVILSVTVFWWIIPFGAKEVGKYFKSQSSQ